MIETGKLLYRPEDWTSEALFYPIDIFAERAKKSRRQIDRHIKAGELTGVKWMGLMWVPIHELERLRESADQQNGPHDQVAGEHAPAGATTESATETESQTEVTR